MEADYDLVPALETFGLGAGPRAGRATIDLSPGAQRRHLARLRNAQARLEAIPVAGLGPSDRAAYALLEHRITTGIERHQSPLRAIQLATPIRNLAGTLVGLAAAGQPFRTGRDFEAWLQRVEATAPQFDFAVEALEAAAASGWTAPRTLVERTLRQVHAMASKPAREGPFWSVVARYPAAAGAERGDYERRYAATLEQQLLPAMRRYTAYLGDRYLPKTRAAAGIGALPGGERVYAALVRSHTTLDLTPAEVHAIGRAEVARIQDGLLATARELGFRGRMRELSPWLASHPDNHPFATTEEVLEYLRRAHARLVPAMPRLFHRLPRAGLDIRPTPAATAASASASYSRPTADGSRPGIFFIPILEPREIALHRLAAVLLHEGLPGHHLDVALAMEKDVPRWRKSGYLTVYGEGWALYAESLGHELGVYGDKWALLGRHMLELRRAGRLVVDTGLHAQGWSREQAIRYFMDECGEAERESTVEVERFMADPGQAVAYKIGEREILALREEARKALGPRFDIRDFHEAVLGEGRVPLGTLRERVRAWIAQVAGGA